MSKRKWKRGRQLSVSEALLQIASGRPVYWRNKWTDNGWAKSWQLRMVIGAAEQGVIFNAEEVRHGHS